MKRIFTFILDFDGGTYISQIRADTIDQALRAWTECNDPRADRSSEIEQKNCTWAADLKIVMEEDWSNVVELEGLSGVWFIYFTIDEIPAYLNIVSSNG